MQERAWDGDQEHAESTSGRVLYRPEDDFPARALIRGGRLLDRKIPQPDHERRRRQAHDGQAGGGVRTRDQLYEEAKALGIPGRSKMSKDELLAAVDRRRGRRAS